MTASKGWALVVGFVLFGVLIGGGAAWRRTHPVDAPAALSSGPVPAAPVAGATAARSAAPAMPAVADRGPVPPSAPNPEAVPSAAGSPAITESAAKDPAKDPATDPAKDPQFDIVRVEPSGETVLAGKGAPDADVALVASGKVVGTAKADSNGHFVILPPALKPGSYDLSLRQTPPGQPTADSSQSVAVSVPEHGKGSVVVALAEPGQATRLLSPTQDVKTEDAGKAATLFGGETKFAIHSVDLENGTGFFASGTAKPGTAVHLYLNDSHVADVVAGPDGQWTVKVRKGLTGGHYVVRADAMGAGGSVSVRAEVPFDVPVAMAEAPSPFTAPNPSDADGTPKEDPRPRPDIVAAARSATPAPPAKPDAVVGTDKVEPAKPPTFAAATPATPTSSAADAVVDEIRTALVVRGDNLWDISRARLGQGTRYTQIYAANSGQIRDPKLIYPGQIFVVPHQ